MSDPRSSLVSLFAPSDVTHVNFGSAGAVALEASHFFMVGRLLTRHLNIAGLMGTMPSIWRQRLVVNPPLNSIETWVSILGLPTLLRNRKSLQLIGPIIGKVHRFDKFGFES
ncbi:hypothetical protein ACLB2K_023521 [Fragaria x ananassa]